MESAFPQEGSYTTADLQRWVVRQLQEWCADQWHRDRSGDRDPRWQGPPRASYRTIRPAPAHCPTAPATWVTRWAFAALTPTTPPPRPAALAAPGLACVSPGAVVVDIAGGGARQTRGWILRGSRCRTAVASLGAAADDPAGFTAIGRSAS